MTIGGLALFKMAINKLGMLVFCALAPSFLMAQTASTTPSPALINPPALTIAQLRAGTSGSWQGQLEYLDYRANRWFGIPMTVSIETQIDQVTSLRKADFDDGPVTGMVRITTLSSVDDTSGTESSAVFRKNRPMEADVWQIRLHVPARDATHWTLVAETIGKDGNGQAKLRETTTRDGDSLTTLKEVNPLADGKDEFFARNRTRLTRVMR